jgi:hypothetical protein
MYKLIRFGLLVRISNEHSSELFTSVDTSLLAAW